MSDAPFISINRIHVAEGFEEQFIERFKNRAGLVDGMPGFIRNEVMRPIHRTFNHKEGQWEETAGDLIFLVRTTWRSFDDFVGWTRSDAFRKAHADRPPKGMFAGPNVLELYECVLQSEGL